jgi:hypothetical protein
MNWLVNHKRVTFYPGSAVVFAFLAMLGISGSTTPVVVSLALIGFFDVIIAVCGEEDSTITWRYRPFAEHTSDLLSCVDLCVDVLKIVSDHLQSVSDL